MKYTEDTVLGGVEILASNDFQAIPVTVTETDPTLAGPPIDADGEACDGTDAIGILLYDVDPSVNPNGAAVVIGIIDSVKAQAHSGVTYAAAALKAALPGIVLRDNINS